MSRLPLVLRIAPAMPTDPSNLPADWWKDVGAKVQFDQENQKKAGTKAWKRYEEYKSATTVGEAIDLGASREDLLNDLNRSFLTVTVSSTPPSADDLSETMRRLHAAKRVLSSPGAPANTPKRDRTEHFGIASPARLDMEFEREVPTPVGVKSETGNDAAPSQDRLLAAIDKLTQKVDNLTFTTATKKDLQDYVQHTKEYVTGELAPLKAEISDMKVRLSAVERAPTRQSPEIQRTMDHLFALSKQVDPNFKRVSFLGFKDVSGTVRTEAIEKFMKKFPQFSDYRVDHEFRGKPGDQVMKNASFIEFSSPDVAKNFLKEVEAKKGTVEFPIGGVIVKRALSKVNRHRNYSLRKAEEVINSKSPGKHVKFDHKERSLSMDGTVVFQQAPNELGGTFLNSMAGSCLP